MKKFIVVISLFLAPFNYKVNYVYGIADNVAIIFFPINIPLRVKLHT